MSKKYNLTWQESDALFAQFAQDQLAYNAERIRIRRQRRLVAAALVAVGFFAGYNYNPRTDPTKK